MTVFRSTMLSLALLQVVLGNRTEFYEDGEDDMPSTRQPSHSIHPHIVVHEDKVGNDLSVVPEPLELKRGHGELTFEEGAQVVVVAATKEDEAALKDHVLSRAKLQVVEAKEVSPGKPNVRLAITSKGMIREGPEAYRLKISKGGVEIEAPSSHGIFNGIMTLRQIMQRKDRKVSFPIAEVNDAPAHEWRGLMLDVSRHFFPADDVKHLLSTMAYFKMNRFHWHLSDDQGWRVPISKYPKLTEVGAWRSGTQEGHSSTVDSVRYGGSYSKEEILDVVSFASSLHIEVVPETDLPGHSAAAIASYPELANQDSSDFTAGKRPEVVTQFGAFKWTMAPKDFSFNFISDLVAEISSLVNSKYYHLGGDEVNTDQWTSSRSAQEFMSQNHLGRPQQLEGRFTQKAISTVNGLGRRGIVWDEAMDSGQPLPADTIVMLWRSWLGIESLAEKAKTQGHSVVMCPQDRTYLDAWQSENHWEEKYDAIGGFTDARKTYDMSLHAGGAHVLGGQGQLWSEYIKGGRPNLDYMAWPRGAAIAEATWSADHRPGFEDFKRRMQMRLMDLDEMSVNYHRV